MQSNLLVEVEPGVQRRATCKTSPIGDLMYMKYDEMLNKCVGDCPTCPVYHECLFIDETVSSLSAHRRLSPAKLKIYLERLRNLPKPEKADPLSYSL